MEDLRDLMKDEKLLSSKSPKENDSTDLVQVEDEMQPKRTHSPEGF